LATLNNGNLGAGNGCAFLAATATGGMGIGIKAAVVAAKTLALTAAQLYQSSKPSRRQRPSSRRAADRTSSTNRSPARASRRSITGKTSSGVAAADAAPG